MVLFGVRDVEPNALKGPALLAKALDAQANVNLSQPQFAKGDLNQQGHDKGASFQIFKTAKTSTVVSNSKGWS
jgi:hypothetical protein